MYGNIRPFFVNYFEMYKLYLSDTILMQLPIFYLQDKSFKQVVCVKIKSTEKKTFADLGKK